MENLKFEKEINFDLDSKKIEVIDLFISPAEGPIVTHFHFCDCGAGPATVCNKC